MKLRLFSSFAVLIAAPSYLFAQPAATCQPSAVPSLVRAEGVAERVGDIIMICSGTPGREVVGNLSVFLNTMVTSRVIDSTTLDVVLTVNGSLANARGQLGGNNLVTFPGLRFTVPGDGQVELRISNLRGDMTQLPAGGFVPPTVIARIAFSPSGPLLFSSTELNVATPQPGLFAAIASTVIPSHAGSPLPAEGGRFRDFLAAGSYFATTRVTEGFQSSFLPRDGQSTQGTRVMLRFSGYPADARLFVPAAIAGSTAAQPTVAGDFGGTASGGRYRSGSGTLLLSRVQFTAPDGSGGTTLTAPGDESELSTMTEVQLVNGSGTAVYEVVDSSTQTLEFAQIPVFLGIPRSISARSEETGLTVTFAPVSTTNQASATAPVPRFRGTPAGSDCSFYRDCEPQVPRLWVPPFSREFTLVRGVGNTQRIVNIFNSGTGTLEFTTRIEYTRGTGWIETFYARDLVLNVRALPDMAPGVYEATLIVDAGPAGAERIPLRLTVVESPTSPPGPETRPAVTSIVNGASFAAGAVAPGALATLRGARLGGTNVSVTFDGKPATILYTSADQINIRVPADLAGNTSQVVVTIDGVASTATTVNVAAASPGVFANGVLNQDGTVNSATNPANAGSVIQIFATGLQTPQGTGTIDVRVHEFTYTSLAYAGPAPNLPGIQQVNLLLEPEWNTISTTISVCTNAGGQRQCSAPVPVHIRGR